MGNVKIMQRFVRRLTKNSSGTISVTIPVEYAYELGWEKGVFVLVELRGREIIIKETS